MGYNWENYYSSKKAKKSSYYDDYDDYYGGGNWSWGNYGRSYYQEDDDKDLYVRSSDSYYTPKGSDFEYRLTHTSNTKANRTLIKEMSRFFYHKMVDNKEYFEDRFKDPDKLKEDELANFEAKKQYYQALWDKDIPGYTPLEQALFVFSQLEEEAGKEKGSFSPKELQQTAQGIKVNKELYNDAVFNELIDLKDESKKKKFKLLNKISLIKNLGSEFKVQKEVEEKITSNSNIYAKKIMRDFAQMHNIELYQRLMPDFPIKLITKNLVVNVPIDKTDHKQKIIMLLDYSGSMRDEEKQDWVNALMIDRLRYCIKEEAEIFFSYFIHDTSELKFHHIYDRKSAIEFWKTFSNHPNGGTTRIGEMVNYVKDQIENKHKLHNLNIDLSAEKPEILIMNDGQDDVQTNKFEYKVNAITLVDSENDGLRKLSLETKGKYVYISGNIIKTYSESGVQTMKN